MKTCVYLGQQLAAYSFGDDHPFGPRRYDAFSQALLAQGLDERLSILSPVMADRALIQLFHTPTYVQQVIERSLSGEGFLDLGDTPAFKGVYEAAANVVGSVINAVDRLLDNQFQQAFIPIAGLHHARRNGAAGFCVFNDCGIAIEYLKHRGLKQILYVDIDAHHGDGVFYGFESDPAVVFVDLHESGDYLYPGTGSSSETGKGDAQGYKLNIPMPPGADDEAFYKAWAKAEAFIEGFSPEFIVLQCGVDSIKGDPITHMAYSSAVHSHVTRALMTVAARHSGGRLLALGGGGYRLENIAAGWTAVVRAMLAC